MDEDPRLEEFYKFCNEIEQIAKIAETPNALGVKKQSKSRKRTRVSDEDGMDKEKAVPGGIGDGKGDCDSPQKDGGSEVQEEKKSKTDMLQISTTSKITESGGKKYTTVTFNRKNDNDKIVNNPATNMQADSRLLPQQEQEKLREKNEKAKKEYEQKMKRRELRKKQKEKEKRNKDRNFAYSHRQEKNRDKEHDKGRNSRGRDRKKEVGDGSRGGDGLERAEGVGSRMSRQRSGSRKGEDGSRREGSVHVKDRLGSRPLIKK